MQRRGISGASLAVTRNSKLMLARGYTYSNDMEDSIVEPLSVFRIASISKPFTSAAVLRLVQDGQLDLTDKLVDLLQLAPPRGQVPDPYLANVTVLNLLQHLGGWDRGIAFDPLSYDFQISRALNVSLPISTADIVTYMIGQSLQHSPGTTFAYSNYGYCLLARIIESLAGMPYQDYVKAKVFTVFTPLSIATAALGRTRYIHRLPQEVKYHTGQRGPTVLDNTGVMVSGAYGTFNIENKDSEGGWLISAVDLARFASTFDDPGRSPVLSSGSVDVMYSFPENIDSSSYVPGDWYYGCGWSVRDWGSGGRNTWHGGYLPGTRTLLVRRRDGINWCVLFNQSDDPSGADYGEIDSLLHAAADAVSVWPDHDLFSEYLPLGVGNRLSSGQRLHPGQFIQAEDAACRLVFQTDGDLVAYRNDVAHWSAGALGAAGGFAVMQPDGNFVVYDAAGGGRWATHTTGNPGAFLAIRTDCNVALYSAAGALLWGTGGP